MGHYDDYTESDFDALIATLERIEGKFLLSSFRNTSLYEAVERNRWASIEIKMSKPMSRNSKNKRGTKLEVLTANYPIDMG